MWSLTARRRLDIDGSTKAIWAWALYDWANSSFTTLVVTFIYGTYFTQAIAPDEVTGTALWSRAIVVTGVVVALASPILGALADRSGTRHRYLVLSTLICIAATAGLTFVAPGSEHAVLMALSIVVVANVAFEIGLVFYNAFLPQLAPAARIGRVSGYGWALGYVGGLACLGLALAVLVREVPMFGISTEAGFNYRSTNLLVAAWFLVFSIPIFVYLGDRQAPRASVGIAAAVRGVAETLRNVRRFPDVVRFVVARMIYNDGLVTIFAFGGIYAAGTFGMSLSEVIQFGIGLNLAAGIGAWLFASVDDRIGGKRTILISLVGLCAMTLLAVVATDRTTFWIAGLGIGVLVGPNQSASRSLMGRFVPQRHQNEFFGFFAFSGKLTAFMGPLLLGILTQSLNSQRLGVASVLVFFVVGALLLATVDERRGIEAAASADQAPS